MNGAPVVRVPASSANLGPGFAGLVAAAHQRAGRYDPEEVLAHATALEGHPTAWPCWLRAEGEASS